MVFHSVEELYADALSLAESQRVPPSIDHFWGLADRRLQGADFGRTKDLPRKQHGTAPRDIEGLVDRAADYLLFDRTIAKYGVRGDPDVEASIRRVEIFENNYQGEPK